LLGDLFKRFDDLGWDASSNAVRGYRLGDKTHSTNDGIVPNRDTLKNHAATTYPNTASNRHRFRRTTTVAACEWVLLMEVAIENAYLVTKKAFIPDRYALVGYDRDVVARGASASKFYQRMSRTGLK
jgi:hypothetical protein